MSWFKPTSLLDKTYEIGILIKGIDGVLELIGGVLVLVVPPHTIDAILRFLTQHELSRDPHDFVATHILAYGHELERGSTTFAAVFLLTHGLVKVVLVASLLRNKLWAYPFALVTLGLFIVYQIYRMIVQPTFGMAFLTILDTVIVWLIWREWGQVKRRPRTAAS
jgi:uncharacterized membrane protein